MSERLLEAFDAVTAPSGCWATSGPVNIGVVRQCPLCLLVRDYSATEPYGNVRAAWALVEQAYEQHRCQTWKAPYRRVRGLIGRTIGR